ncbi:integrating conjugative element protein [Xanthomonas oryzae pv. oryzicola]|uniref:integrating conjugative element protein n=1 Tax=Xanthomonas oryzae TaxID=347 RepID=UPI000B4182FB|nr:integrating conjugative element protein [Xanthomonas oryzae]OWB27871.1 integrating conjugative element protein [Xanthomonas oryzae pv. oryzicola]QBG94584.1 integrating conjugative element protein [Xanthomonas oryzae]QBH01370.1 integrating conjugative element protein [Xanthomonas oryzae]
MNIRRPYHRARALLAISLLISFPLAICAAPAPVRQPISRPELIVVEDHGGVAAQPYYDDLGLPAWSSAPPEADPLLRLPVAPMGQRRAADMVPVHSTLLVPGTVERRPLQAPGLTPFFLIGDDPRSRDWLQRRLGLLQDLRASGLIVNVESARAVEALRQVAPGVALSPVSGDDLAQRLGLHHYPVLITATGIEQ